MAPLKHSLVSRLRKFFLSAGSRSRQSVAATARRLRTARPAPELLEDRLVPTTLTVTSPLEPAMPTAGTLRYAVNLANMYSAQGSPTAILFNTAGWSTNTITEQQGTLAITAGAGAITINGGCQVTVSGNNANSVFSISTTNSNTLVTLAGLTITNGNAKNGGGIIDTGTLAVINCSVTGNVASNEGGGICNVGGTVTLSASTVSRNSSFWLDGGVTNTNNGTMTLIECTVSGNIAPANCGGVDNDGGTMSLSYCTVSGNSGGSSNSNGSTTGVGGITNYGTMTLSNCTVSGNSSPVSDGGIGNQGGTMTLRNCTVSGNSAPYIGGIGNIAGMMTLSGCTVSGNFAGNSCGGVYVGWNYPPPVASTLLIAGNTIIAGNTAPSNPDLELHSTFTDLGHNLIGVNPLLGPLQNNGGPTQTMAPQPGSPAIGAGDTSVSLTATDQRGAPRLTNGALDIGAFQSGNVFPAPVTPPPPIPVTDSNGSPVQIAAGLIGPDTPSQVSPASIRYLDGVVRWSRDLLPWGQTLSWTNGPGYASHGFNGSGMVVAQQPYLIPANGTQTVVLITSGTTSEYFDANGSGGYSPRFFDQNRLAYDPTSNQFTLIDTTGDQFLFRGFGVSIPSAQQGQLLSLTDPAGNVTSVSYTPNGKVQQVTRSLTANGTTVTQACLYNYDANTGLVQSVMLLQATGGGAWTMVRQVVYTYYDSTQSFGNPGDLQFAAVKDDAGNALDTWYFRYYTPGQAGGYAHGLMYVFGPESYARLLSAVGGNPSQVLQATNAQVAPYADNYFQYDSQQRVTLETVQGQGTSTDSYSPSGNASDYNSWAMKTVETQPDGNQNIVYTNAYGEVMLKVYKDTTTGQQWVTFYKYDGQGRETLMASPSAVTGFNDAYPDLLHSVNGSYQYLSNGSGLISITDYYSDTTAGEGTAGDVAGYVQDTKIQQGQQGTPILQETMQYSAHTANGVTVDRLATDTVYRNTDGTGMETTSYSYAWFPGTTQVLSTTTTLPGISAAENGPGTLASSISVDDTYGREVWHKDAVGTIDYTAYDAATGAVIETITDVNTSNTSDFSNLPAGWVTPPGGGLNLVTAYQVDALGRTTAETSPNGNVTYTVYKDLYHESLVYPGWNSSTLSTTGPTRVYREDRAGSYTETFTMLAAPHLTNGVPDGTEPISNLLTLSRSYTNAAGQVVEDDSYFNLNGLTYSTVAVPHLGAPTSNSSSSSYYYATQYGYDADGRQNQVQKPTGTIDRTVYDGQGRVVSTWVGTNAGMVEVSADVYDNGGTGDGNLTQETEFPGGGAAPRVTQYFYDWRDRRVAEKDGVQASENDGTNRPITYTTYDNLDQAVLVQRYEGEGVSISTVNGVPQQPAASLLRKETAYAYDEQGRVYLEMVYSVIPTTGTMSGSALTTNRYFDLRGDQVAESDPGGLWTKNTYDGAGHLVVGYTTDGFNGTSWAAADTVVGDIVLEQVETSYDGDGNVIETIDRQRFNTETATGALRNATTAPLARDYYSGSYYDAADRLTADVNVGTNGGSAWVRPATPPARSANVLVTSETYNAAGWVQDTKDPRGIDTHTVYDALRRTVETIDNYTGQPETAQSDVATLYTYDGDNNVLTVTAMQPIGTASQTTAEGYGAITVGGSVVNSNDLLTATVYPDPATGQPSSSPSQRMTCTYNALGQVTSMTDRNGTTHVYTYDVLGRQTSDTITVFGPGVDSSVRRIDTAYDQQGNAYLFTSYSDTAIVNQVEDVYNGLGQLTAEYQSHSGPVNTNTTPAVYYKYTEMFGGVNNSRLVSTTYPNGRVVYDGYNAGLDDSISRLSAIYDSTQAMEAYSYLGLDTVVVRAHPQTNVNLTYVSPTGATGSAGDQYTGLDRFGRVAQQLWINVVTGAATDNFGYTYDADSNIRTKNNYLHAALNETYNYDGLNRLISFTQGSTYQQSWGLDALGNWTSVTTNNVTETRTTNAQNELTSVSGGAPSGYDSNGNMTADPKTGNTYVYDAWNRLVAVRNGITTLAFYSYDAEGRRITETSANLSDLYYNGQSQVIEEDAVGKTQYQYVWSPLLPNTLVERDSKPDSSGKLALRLYVQQDATGNVTALVNLPTPGNTSGKVAERIFYNAYGQGTFDATDWSRPVPDADTWVYLYQGGRLEGASGLYYRDGRDYSPVLGLWTDQTLSGPPAGGDAYCFLGDNPVKPDPQAKQPPAETGEIESYAEGCDVTGTGGGTLVIDGKKVDYNVWKVNGKRVQGVNGVEISTDEIIILGIVNLARAANGQRPLIPDPKLMKDARDYAALMAKQGKMAHNLNGNSLARVQKVMGNVKITDVQENLASGMNVNAARLFYAWRDETLPGKPHWKTLLRGDFELTGIGVAIQGNMMYAAEVFSVKPGQKQKK